MFERLGTLPDTVARHASFLADERISELAADMRKHPQDYPEYYQAQLAADQAAQAVRDALGDRQHLLTTLVEAITVRDSIECDGLYRLGFMDGGRVYHDFVVHELPHDYPAIAKEEG